MADKYRSICGKTAAGNGNRSGDQYWKDRRGRNPEGGDGTQVIGLRADMDCICIEEMAKELPHCSVNPDRMHACGHDGHMSTLLGAARLLSESRDFNGTVRFIFQPAEESGYGSVAMMEMVCLNAFR